MIASKILITTRPQVPQESPTKTKRERIRKSFSTVSINKGFRAMCFELVYKRFKTPRPIPLSPNFPSQEKSRKFQVSIPPQVPPSPQSQEHMAWLSGSNPFFKKVKITKTSLLNRKKFTKTKAKEIQDPRPKIVVRPTSPLETWRYRSRKVMVQFPSPQGDDPLGFVLLVTLQSSSQEKGALQCTRPSKKSPFKTRERKKDLLEMFSDF